MASGGGEAVEIGSDSKLGGVGSRSAGAVGGGGQYFRADTVDFSKWDLHMGQGSSSATRKTPMQEWEIYKPDQFR